MIYDCFSFFNELDIFDDIITRISSLKDFVNKYIFSQMFKLKSLYVGGKKKYKQLTILGVKIKIRIN